MGVPIPQAFLPTQRRTFGRACPGQQIRLAITVLGITGVFLALAVGNGYAAYSAMLKSAAAMTPEIWQDDLIAQTRPYIVVSSTLAFGYFLAIVGVSIAFVHRVVSPMVALRRHVRELGLGRYGSRVRLRTGGGLLGELGDQLNELAASLENEQEKGRAT